MIAIAAGSFFFYTNPHYKNIQSLRSEVAEYQVALVKAKEAERIKADLAVKRDSFTQEDIDQLQKLLPDSVDNIRLLLDINQIAAGYGSTISGIKVDAAQADKSASGEKPVYGAVTIGFTVTMPYQAFLSFLKDLEHNLRITDLTVLGFNTSETGLYSYNVSLKTYWLQ